MITKQTYALLALHVYAADPDDKNKPILPPNWTPIEQIEGTYDFACTVYFAADVVDGTLTSDKKIDRVEFASGVVWDQVKIQSLVDQATNNHTPVASGTVPTLQARAGSVFSYIVPIDTIADADVGDIESATICLHTSPVYGVVIKRYMCYFRGRLHRVRHIKSTPVSTRRTQCVRQAQTHHQTHSL